MKHSRYILLIIILISVTNLAAQNKVSRIPMMGESAPAFVAESTNGTINFPDDYLTNWKIIFSHPADFTPVCSTELLELSALQNDLKSINTKIIVVSVDPVAVHEQWVKSLESIDYKGTKCPEINFPLVGDVDYSVSKKYGMVQTSTDERKDVRGVFIIDPKNKIRAIMFYPMAVGRNLDEVKRTVIALQTSDKQKVLTPANWKPGEDVLVPFTNTKEESAKSGSVNDPDYYQLAWYMNYKKIKE